MLKYRFATSADDLDELTVAGIKALQDLTLYRDSAPITHEAFKQRIHAFINSPSTAILLMLDDETLAGFIAFVIAPDLLQGDVTATEILLWIDKDKRGKGGFRQLIKIYEDGARKLGCTKITLACYHVPGGEDDRVAKLYTRMNYKQAETMFIKELN